MNQAGGGGGVSRIGAFSWRHRALLWRATLVLLVVIVILQNVEPTTIDVLFWSIARVPKLVLIVASMAIGIVLWELGKRAASRGR